MNVSLTPELEQFIADKVESGMYQTASEVVREGLRLLKQREEERREFVQAIQQGMKDIEEGRTRPAREALAELGARLGLSR